MTKDINEIIKSKIKTEYEDSKLALREMKERYERAKKRVKDLEKSLTCEHSFDSGSDGFSPIGWDICSKCGWHHVY